MKIAVIADLHGNYYALQSVLDCLQKKHIDKIFLAGDIIGGPKPNIIIDLVKNSTISAIIGNQEEYLFDQLQNPKKYDSQRWGMIKAVNQRITNINIDYLRKLPKRLNLFLNNHKILISHSTPENSNEVFFPEKNIQRVFQILDNVSEDIFICGHSHRQWTLNHNKTLAINPGSVGFPIGDRFKVYFTILSIDSELKVDNYKIDYDHSGFLNDFKEEEFFNRIGPIGKAMFYTLLSGESVLMDFISYIKKINNIPSTTEIEISDQMLFSAEKKYYWEKYECYNE